MRLIGILLAVFLFTGGSLLMTRFWGLGMQYQAYEHPYTKDMPKTAVRIQNLGELQSLIASNPESLVWVDIRQTKDGKLLVLPEVTPEKTLTVEAIGMENYRGNKPNDYDLIFLRKFFADAPLLEDIVAKAPNSKFVFNVIDSVLDVDKNVITFVEANHLESRVMIQSPAAVVITAIKGERPTWIFGSSQTDWVKLLSFQSAFVLPAAPFKGDILSMPLQFNSRDMINEDLISEMHRRFKKVFVGPLTNVEQVKKAQTLNPDLYIISSPDLLREVNSEIKSK